MPTLTTNFDFNKPNVNSSDDEDLWGGLLNDNWDSIDNLLLKSADSPSNPKSTTYTILASDRNKIVLADAAGGAFNINLLPAATATDGFSVSIKKVDSSANSITIDGDGAETIDGDSSITLDTQYDSVVLVCDGSNWSIKSDAKTTSVPDASTTVKGIIQIATNSESNAGTETSKSLVPSNFGQNSLATNGYQRLPGGLIMQWGTTSSITRGTTGLTVTLPLTFPNNFFSVYGHIKKNSGNASSVWSTNAQVQSLSQFDIWLGGNASGSFPVYWFAIGN